MYFLPNARLCHIRVYSVPFVPVAKEDELREAEIERELKRKVEDLGGLCLKWVSPGNRGVPDRIVIHDGNVYFVELKRPGGKLSPLQEHMRREIQKRLCNVHVIANGEDLDDFLWFMKNGWWDGL